MFNFNNKFGSLLTILIVLTGIKGFSQTFTVNPSNTVFTLSTSTQVLNTNTIPSAFSLSVNSLGKAYNLSASVVTKVYNPASAPFTSIPLSISLRSITGVNNTTGVTGDIPLFEAPLNSALATKATRTGPTATAVWTYDLILASVGFTIPPGTYNYTVSVQYSDGSPTPLTGTFNIILNVQSVVNVSLNQTSSATVTFGSSANYTNGITSLNFHSLQVQSNMSWLINVSAPQYFTAGGGGASTNMPSNIMSIRRNGTSTFMPLSTLSQTIASGSAGDISASGNTSSYDMQFNPGYSYNPGIYNISLTYTLTGQ
jgi:uncharacterized membrane protein YdcZ (DUF606 family)